MSKKILLGIGIVIVLLLAYGAYYFLYGTRQASPLDTTSFTRNDFNLSVTYSRPSKKERLIFDGSKDALQPFGVYWRMGANRATKLSINKAVKIAGNFLGEGEYAVYAIPGPSTWTVAFNTDFDRWGASPADPSKDVFRIEVPVDYSNPVVEMLTISFKENQEGANLVVEWDTARISIPITL